MHFPFSRRRRALPAIVAVVVTLTLPLALPLAAFSQDDGDAGAPATAARIDALSGDVAIQRGDANETLAAVQNAPVLSADYITTGQNGRAEVGFDGRSAVRLGENVQIRFVDVDPADRQMQLAAGTIDVRLFGDTDGRSTIDTPSISVVPRSAGSFRIAVDNDGNTAVTVRSGRADIVTPHGNQSIAPGTTVLAGGPAADPSLQTRPAIALDGFDAYNGERDRIYVAATSQSRYVNTNIQGVGDLAAAGNWVDDGSYGHVWIPTAVAPGWAPYREGNWVWEGGFGWTWVAAEPWGWAPYHYGRWYFSTAYNHWAWYPPAPARFAPAWSPALVGFVGFNIGAVNVGIGFGNIGWVPLAPNEAFHPWWGPHAAPNASTAAVNVHYRNIAVNGALTSVTRENFQNGRFANPQAVSQRQLRTLRPVAVQGALPIQPTHANLRFTQRSAPPSLPAYATRTPFVSRQYVRPAAPAYTRPTYDRPAYSRPATQERPQRVSGERAPNRRPESNRERSSR